VAPFRTTVGKAEEKVFKSEGFKIRIKWLDGQDARSDAKISGRYKFDRTAADSQTVTGWIKNRFEESYPNLAVDVLLSDGQIANGLTKLKNVRSGYN